MRITLADVIDFLVAKAPGRTEAQLAEAIFGDAGYQQRVNGDCRLLEAQGRIARRGSGGPNDPFKYYPVAK